MRRYALALCALTACANGNSLKEFFHEQPRLPPHDPWQDCSLLREEIDVDGVVSSPSPDAIARAVTQLEEVTAILESGALGDDIPACYRQQEIADFVNMSAQKLLYANRQTPPAGRDGRTYDLARLIARTNFTSNCGDQVVGGVRSTDLAQARADSGYDAREDERLWKQYGLMLGRLDEEARGDPDAAMLPHVVPYLEGMAAIAEDPALSCEHAEAIREKVNFVAPNALAVYQLSGHDPGRELTIRFGNVIAATEAAYSCEEAVSDISRRDGDAPGQP